MVRDRLRGAGSERMSPGVELEGPRLEA